ncbi:MAG: aldehyde ferredoxin oxidoreductase family protein [Desulfobacteria bacterium]
MNILPGYMGQGLLLNLSLHTAQAVPLSEEMTAGYLGGRGFGIPLMKDWINTDPFHSDMPLLFNTGPLNNTGVYSSGRGSLVSRSPLTGTLFDASFGGRFAHCLKGAGFDYLSVQGKSSTPVVVKIRDGKATFVPGDQLWGKTTVDTHDALKKDGATAVIGPAGENRVLFANVCIDGRYFAGRGGLGAVMGNKNLKGIVVSGNKKPFRADTKRINTANREILRLFKASPVLYGPFGIRRLGTPALVDVINARRMMPTANFRKTYFRDARRFSGVELARQEKRGGHGCYACPIGCKKTMKGEGPAPEYESVSHFGALNSNNDLSAIIRANDLCNRLGMDTISTGSTIACFAEINGANLNGDSICSMIQDIACRKGEGDILAAGSVRYAKRRGRPDTAMAVKGLELAAYDPRGAYGMALAYGTAQRGGCHLRAYPVGSEVLRRPVPTDRFSFEGKARLIKIAEDVNAAADSLVVCKFGLLGASLEEYASALSGVIGVEISSDDLLCIGERICLAERYLNSLNGFSRKDDYLPDRFYKEEGSSGAGIDVPAISKRAYDEALDRYYRARGCDSNGIPLNLRGIEG